MENICKNFLVVSRPLAQSINFLQRYSKKIFLANSLQFLALFLSQNFSNFYSNFLPYAHAKMRSIRNEANLNVISRFFFVSHTMLTCTRMSGLCLRKYLSRHEGSFGCGFFMEILWVEKLNLLLIKKVGCHQQTWKFHLTLSFYAASEN